MPHNISLGGLNCGGKREPTLWAAQLAWINLLQKFTRSLQTKASCEVCAEFDKRHWITDEPALLGLAASACGGALAEYSRVLGLKAASHRQVFPQIEGGGDDGGVGLPTHQKQLPVHALGPLRHSAAHPAHRRQALERKLECKLQHL